MLDHLNFLHLWLAPQIATCHSVGANVEFIASKAEGGTITCEGEAPEARPARLPGGKPRAR